MKKLFAAIIMMVSVFGSVYATGGTNVDRRVEAAFKKEFAGARAVKWNELKNEHIWQAQFIYNNERINAYFDEEGTLIATGRFIAQSSLPFLIRKNVNKQYGSYKVREVIEYVRNNETSYLLSVENEKQKLLLQAYNSGSMYIFKKEKKNEVAKL